MATLVNTNNNENTLKQTIPIKIIFLDVDGVLLPFNSTDFTFSKISLQVLNDIVKYTGAEIVLSSTWRMDESAIDTIYDNFKDYPMLSTVKFKQWNRTCPTLHIGRAIEIKDFIENKAPKLGLQIKKYLVIDDEPVVIPNKKPFDRYFVNKCIQTDSHIGLREEHLKQALDILSVQNRNENNNIKISCVDSTSKKNDSCCYENKNTLLKQLHVERMKRKAPTKRIIKLKRFCDQATLNVQMFEKPGKQIGTIIWPGSILLAEFLFSNQHLFQYNHIDSGTTTTTGATTNIINQNIAIELGSGCGLVGITYALLKLGKVVLTEQKKDGIFEVLNSSIGLNFNNTSNNDNTIINVKEYEWGRNNTDIVNNENDGYNIILAADCLYSKQCVAPLYTSITENLITRKNQLKTKFILSYRPRDFHDEIEFFKLMLDAKFHIYKIVMNSAIDRRLKQIVEIKQIEALYAEFNVSVAHPPTVDNNGRIDQLVWWHLYFL